MPNSKPPKVVTIVGARPQFIKAAAVSRSLKRHAQEIILHTGQHYDDNLSQVFFDELEIPLPDYNLGVGSATHGAQTGQMLEKTEAVLIDEAPDWVVVYGDTNSTLAGALAAAKLHIKVAHIEAGLRSYNRHMPEEINRVLIDHISDILFCPSKVAVKNLKKEGIVKNVVIVGDVMADSLNFAAKKAVLQSTILDKLGLTQGQFYLATIHRAENTEDKARLKNILDAFASLNAPIIIPLHPRTRLAIEKHQLGSFLHNPNIKVVAPLGYLDMVRLEQAAKMILTDSGGIQKEAYWLKVPCITLRDETEWVETVEFGWNILTGANTARILDAVKVFSIPKQHPVLYGTGKAGGKIVKQLLDIE